MKMLETDAVISADGSVRLLSPLPAWLKAGRRRLLLVMEETGDALPSDSGRVTPKATPEMMARRKAALDGLRASDNVRSIIPDPAAWQEEVREDRALPSRE